MPNRRNRFILVPLAMIGLPASATAGTVRTQFHVGATVVSTCRVTIDSADAPSANPASVSCTHGGRWSVSVGRVERAEASPAEDQAIADGKPSPRYVTITF